MCVFVFVGGYVGTSVDPPPPPPPTHTHTHTHTHHGKQGSVVPTYSFSWVLITHEPRYMGTRVCHKVETGLRDIEEQNEKKHKHGDAVKWEH